MIDKLQPLLCEACGEDAHDGKCPTNPRLSTVRAIFANANSARRIALALERIADALESQNGRPPSNND